MPRQATAIKDPPIHRAETEAEQPKEKAATAGGDGEGPDDKTKHSPMGHNGYDAEKMWPYIAEIEASDRMIEAIMDKARDDAEPHRQAIADQVKKAAEDGGFPKTEFKTMLRMRKLERKLAGVDGKLHDDEKMNFAMMKKALGDYASTPLGAAAVAGAEPTQH